MNPPDIASDESRDAKPRRPWLRAVQILVTLGALGWIATQVDTATLWRALSSLPAVAVLSSLGWYSVALLIGAVRWRWLLIAYGADRLPPRGWLLRVYLVGMFYNTYVPGGIGGDLVRGVAVRRAFDVPPTVAAARGVAVSLVERVIGLFGLMVVVSVATTFWPLQGVQELRPMAILVLLVAVSSVAVLALAPRLAHRLPPWAADKMQMIPTLESAVHLALGTVASLFTHLAVAMAGHALVSAMDPSALVTESVVVVPLSLATAFLPITLSGMGVREATFAVLYSQVGVPYEVGFAAAVALFGVQLLVAGVGGLIILLADPGADAREGE